MALVTINDLTHTLQSTRATLLAATTGDGIVSRADHERLLEETEDPVERQFLEFFYGFLIELEDRPRMRVTDDVIDRGIAFIQEQIIPNFEIQTSFLSPTKEKIAQVHEMALPMATELIRMTAENVLLSPREVSEQMESFTEGLLFDDFGSEAGIEIEPIFVEHPAGNVGPDSFVEALGLELHTPRNTVSRFESADKVLAKFLDQHIDSGNAENANALVDLMQANLSDFKIIILGEDNDPALESNHPTYVVGRGNDGNLAGFETVVIWT